MCVWVGGGGGVWNVPSILVVNIDLQVGGEFMGIDFDCWLVARREMSFFQPHLLFPTSTIILFNPLLTPSFVIST